jgi:hypothetical protein
MRLGPLQKYIIISSRTRRGPVPRKVFLEYYKGEKNSPNLDDRINAITKALEKMVRGNLIIAEGVKTAEKFFIQRVKLTKEGRRIAKKVMGSQQKLPIRIKK